MLPCVIASRQRLACMSCVHDTECNDLILVMQHFLNVEHMCWSLLCIMLFLFNDSRIWMQSFPCVSYCYLSTRALSQTDVTLKHRFHTNTLPYCFSIAALTRILSHTTRTTQTLYTRCYVFLVLLCRCLGARVLSHTTHTTQTLYTRCYVFLVILCRCLGARVLSHTTRTTQTLYICAVCVPGVSVSLPWCQSIKPHYTHYSNTVHTLLYVFLVILCRCLGARVWSHTTRTTQTLYTRCYTFLL